VLCRRDRFAQSPELGEDGISGGRPHEGSLMLIPVVDEAFDLSAQVAD
jgi:hypothetical protein